MPRRRDRTIASPCRLSGKPKWLKRPSETGIQHTLLHLFGERNVDMGLWAFHSSSRAPVFLGMRRRHILALVINSLLFLLAVGQVVVLFCSILPDPFRWRPVDVLCHHLHYTQNVSVRGHSALGDQFPGNHEAVSLANTVGMRGKRSRVIKRRPRAVR